MFVCDGVKIKEKAKYRAGQVTKQGAMDYSEFKQRVRQLRCSGKHIPLPENFARSLGVACKKCQELPSDSIRARPSGE